MYISDQIKTYLTHITTDHRIFHTVRNVGFLPPIKLIIEIRRNDETTPCISRLFAFTMNKYKNIRACMKTRDSHGSSGRVDF